MKIKTSAIYPNSKKILQYKLTLIPRSPGWFHFRFKVDIGRSYALRKPYLRY